MIICNYFDQLGQSFAGILVYPHFLRRMQVVEGRVAPAVDWRKRFAGIVRE
jgi:hypothetical protein